MFIPMSQLIGGTRYIGQGWRMLVECLAEGSGISLAGTERRCRQDRQPLHRRLARQSASSSTGRSGTSRASKAARADRRPNLPDGRGPHTDLGALDIGEKPSVISAIVKYHLTENYRRCINDAMDIQGGSGICLGPSNLIGRAYQAIPIAITVEGANILTRSMIIFGQAVRCHPWVLKEFPGRPGSGHAARPGRFRPRDLCHVGFVFGNIARSLFLGLTMRGTFQRTGRRADAPLFSATALDERRFRIERRCRDDDARRFAQTQGTPVGTSG